MMNYRKTLFCFLILGLVPMVPLHAGDPASQKAAGQPVSGSEATGIKPVASEKAPKNLIREPDNDPIEGYNRAMFAFNDFFNGYVFRPIAIGYSYVIPEYGRKKIAAASDNVQMPDRLINCWLQARFKRSGIEFSRFLVNTTAGVGGLYDPAKEWLGLNPQANSFGDTFYYWGIGKGCYIVLPFQGNSTIRDAIGLPFDWMADPLTWIPPYNNAMFINVVSLSIKAGLKTNDMSLLIGDYEKIHESSADPYETLKEYYFVMQKYEHQVLEQDN